MGCHSAANELILIHAFSYEPPPNIRMSCRCNLSASFLRLESGDSNEKKCRARTCSDTTCRNRDANGDTHSGPRPDADSGAGCEQCTEPSGNSECPAGKLSDGHKSAGQTGTGDKSLCSQRRRGRCFWLPSWCGGTRSLYQQDLPGPLVHRSYSGHTGIDGIDCCWASPIKDA